MWTDLIVKCVAFFTFYFLLTFRELTYKYSLADGLRLIQRDKGRLGPTGGSRGVGGI